jgi:ABC-type antimicrobial peptide transport system permease subunit
MHPIPPKFAERFLLWFLNEELAEEVIGDLEEQYFNSVKSNTTAKAKLNYWFQVFNYMRPFALRLFPSKNSKYFIMYQHNFKLAYRNFFKYKSQFVINLTGLSTGLACVLFIFLWVSDEQKMDKYHDHDQRLFQIMSNHTDASGIRTWKGVPGLLLEEIQAEVPEVEHAVAMTDPHEYTLSVEDAYHKVDGKFASPGIFDVFTYPLVSGNKHTVLQDKSSIVVTEDLANRLFKTTDIVGKDLKWHFWGREKIVTVSGVMKSLPQNTSKPFDFILSWDYYHDDLISYKNWGNYYGRIMTTLNAAADQASATEKIDAILKKNQEDSNVDLFLAKYSDRYLYSSYENGQQAGGRIEYVHLFSIVALFILFIASINFINLSTAKAAHRTKEIGVKKSLGATRKSLITQYFTESILLSTISLIIAFALVHLLLPQFNFLSQKDLSLVLNIEIISVAIGLIAIVGILAGSYPALFLSGFKPIDILKGKVVRKPGEIRGRKSLVIAQFSLSIILIVSVVVVYQQMEFVKNKNLGFDKENLIYFEREGTLVADSEALVNELKNTPGISNVALSSFMVGGGNSTGGVSWEGKSSDDQIQFWEVRSGQGTVDIMGMTLLEGRDFSEEFGADSLSVIFNEQAIKAMGLTDPIGKTIKHYSGEKQIIGVVKDFNLLSLHSDVEPMIMLYGPKRTHFIMAKIVPGTEVTTMGKMEELYNKFNPGYVFKPEFIDQEYQALYTSEERVGVLSRYFSGLAILISCLGLFALAAFTTERRMKEIGIRKVLGAGTFKIVYLLSNDFTKMVLISIFIALPISFFIAQNWLEGFAFRIDLQWWFFAGAGLLALIVAWLTVGLHTVKAATVNPVTCLKDE